MRLKLEIRNGYFVLGSFLKRTKGLREEMRHFKFYPVSLSILIKILPFLRVSRMSKGIKKLESKSWKLRSWKLKARKLTQNFGNSR